VSYVPLGAYDSNYHSMKMQSFHNFSPKLKIPNDNRTDGPCRRRLDSIFLLMIKSVGLLFDFYQSFLDLWSQRESQKGKTPAFE